MGAPWEMTVDEMTDRLDRRNAGRRKSVLPWRSASSFHQDRACDLAGAVDEGLRRTPSR